MDWLEKLSIGAWKYRKIMATEGGPIARVACRRIPDPWKAQGNKDQDLFEVMAYLRDEFKIGIVNKNLIYGNCDGTGTSTFRHLAIQKAISEALERWAYYEYQNTSQWGFDLDTNSSGMAAFPGFFRNSPRAAALREATERWSLLNWWNGNLPAEIISTGESLHVARLLTPEINHQVALLWKQTSSGAWVYGFACHDSLEQAIQKARIELERNQFVLNSCFNMNPATLESIIEQRLLFFSTSDGHQLFKERLNESVARLQMEQTVPKPLLVVDSEIVGRWTQYANVWRCLWEPSNDLHHSLQLEVFFF